MGNVGYTAEDEILIAERFDDLMESCAKICKREGDSDFIRRAFTLAKEAHKGVRRRSGEPYIIHPIAVAKIVVNEVGLGVKSVVAALLHDVVEDTDYTVEDISNMFGEKIAVMVDGLTKMAGVFNTNTSEQAEYFKKVLLTLSDDVRVILIKIADRLHNMRTLGSMPLNKQIKITSETIYLFAPLAYRLGLYTIKTELEDLSLKYRFPDTYRQIEEKLRATEAGRARFIETFNAPIIEKLRESGIDFEISGRIKSIYSIWSKMQRKQIPFEEVYDLFAIRIVFKPSNTNIVPEKSQCWNIYSLITDIYKPKPDRLRDWITIPKTNGYEALHATVMGPDGIWVEVQIRTERMEEIAERGFAAHWKYKHATVPGDEDEFDKWLKKIREALNSPTENAVDFLDNFKMSLYTTEIVVFTPQGETRTLPQDATALDFAYDIHTKVGHKAIGAKINHKIESIFTPLMSGDQIEILTSENAHPQPEWLEHVKTTKARQCIKNYLNKDTQSNIERGQEIFDKSMHELGITPTGRIFKKVLPHYHCKNKDEFYSKVGTGIIELSDINKVLRENLPTKTFKIWGLRLTNPFKLFGGEGKSGKESPQTGNETEIETGVTGENEPKFVIADCCKPIPGDSVVGFKDTENNRIVVHKASCDELNRLASQFGKNITEVQWSSQKEVWYLSEIELRGIDRKGILLDMAQVITGQMEVNIREIHIQSHDGIFEGTVKLYIRNADDLTLLMKHVSEVKGIEKITRITQ